MDRYLRDAKAWQEHLDRSKKFVLDFAKQKKAGDLAILGSGWLLDVPVREPVETGHKIILVDIFHPRQLRHKLKKYPSVELLEHELTGGIPFQVYNWLKKAKKEVAKLPDELDYKSFAENIKADYFISLNILDQLDGLIIEYLQRNNIMDEDMIMKLRKNIQQSHIESLPPGRSCVIADVEEISRDKTGKESIKDIAYCVFPDAVRQESWIWHYDMTGDYKSGKQSYYKVQALEF